LNAAVEALTRQIVDTNNQRQNKENEREADAEGKKRNAEFSKNVAVMSRGVSQVGSSITTMVTNVKRLSDSINSLAETQRRLGVSLTGAMDVRIGALAQSAKSQILAVRGLVDAIKGVRSALGPPVRPQDILDAQQAYAEEFGAIISSAAGRGLAQQASQMGITADKIVKSTRVFMGASLNDYNRSLAMQSKFMTSFRGQGLAPRAAYEAIIKYSDLIARNGDRFAAGFARAAADAKKIGADLNKIEQFADSMVDDFEGFLEKQGELAAMGFTFDASRLFSTSASGSTEEFANELRSQLAATGKNLENLNRFERRAIENAFGITIGEIQRLAGVTPTIAGGGAEGLENTQSLVSDIKKLLEGSDNPIVKTLTSILNKYEVFDRIESILNDPSRARMLLYGLAGTGGIIGLVITGLGVLGAVLKPVITMFRGLMTVFNGLFKLLGVSAPGAGGVGGVGGGGFAGMIARTTSMFRVGQGIIGGILGFVQSRKQGASVAESLGGGVVRGGAGVLGGMALGGILGSTFLGPGFGTLIGTAIGGFIGDSVGKALNDKLPELRKMFGGFFTGAFEGFKSGWESIKQKFMDLKDAIEPMVTELSKLGREVLKLIGGTEDEGLRRLQSMFRILGFTVTTVLVYPLEILMTGIKSILNIIQMIAMVLQGDFAGAAALGVQMAKDIGMTLASPFIRAYKYGEQLNEEAMEEETVRANESASGIRRFARGGPVMGPGTSTSDSIAARLSAGEYVMNARAAQSIGMSNLNMMNQNGVIPNTSSERSIREPTVLERAVKKYVKPVFSFLDRTVDIAENALTQYEVLRRAGATRREQRLLTRGLPLPNLRFGESFSRVLTGLNRSISTAGGNPGPLASLFNQTKMFFSSASGGSDMRKAVLKKLKTTLGFPAGFLPDRLGGSLSETAQLLRNSKLLKFTGTIFKNLGAIASGFNIISALRRGDYREVARSVIKGVLGKVTQVVVSGAISGSTVGVGTVPGLLAGMAAEAGVHYLVDQLFPSHEELRRREQAQKAQKAMNVAPSLAAVTDATSTGISNRMLIAQQERQRQRDYEAAQRMSSILAQSTPRRYHEGGIIGVTGPNEVPAILEQGEAVFTAAQYDRFKNMATTPTPTTPPTAQPTINFDTARLEAKMDAVVQAIASMNVTLDGNRVGRVLAQNTNAGYQVGALR
jgi:hypothetical protein